MSKADGRSRSWCVTIYPKESFTDESLILPACGALLDASSFIIAQAEMCPKTGRFHLQVAVQFKNQRTLAGLKRLHPTAHFEIMRGTWDQNYVYCGKADTKLFGPVRQGTPPKQGERTDISSFTDALSSGSSMRDSALAAPSVYVRYHRGLHAFQNLLQPPRRNPTTAIIYWGPPGTFKTTHALDMMRVDADEAPFIINEAMCSSGKTVWMDGYDGQKDILIDEFYGWLPLTFFLNLLDRIPMRLQTKGGSTQFAAERVFITSNANPTTWYTSICERYTAALPAINRRLRPPVSDVFFMGYGPMMDLPFCPCTMKDDSLEPCPLLHQEAPGPIALSPGFSPPPAPLFLGKRQSFSPIIVEAQPPQKKVSSEKDIRKKIYEDFSKL